MTVRVAKRQRQRVTCPACAAVLTYAPSDTRRVEVPDALSIGRTTWRAIDCPACRTVVGIATLGWRLP